MLGRMVSIKKVKKSKIKVCRQIKNLSKKKIAFRQKTSKLWERNKQDQ